MVTSAEGQPRPPEESQWARDSFEGELKQTRQALAELEWKLRALTVERDLAFKISDYFCGRSVSLGHVGLDPRTQLLGGTCSALTGTVLLRDHCALSPSTVPQRGGAPSHQVAVPLRRHCSSGHSARMGACLSRREAGGSEGSKEAAAGSSDDVPKVLSSSSTSLFTLQQCATQSSHLSLDAVGSEGNPLSHIHEHAVLQVSPINRRCLGELRSYKNCPPNSIIYLWACCLLILGYLSLEEADQSPTVLWKSIQKHLVAGLRADSGAPNLADSLTAGALPTSRIACLESLSKAQELAAHTEYVKRSSMAAGQLEAWVASVLDGRCP